MSVVTVMLCKIQNTYLYCKFYKTTLERKWLQEITYLKMCYSYIVMFIPIRFQYKIKINNSYYLCVVFMMLT